MRTTGKITHWNIDKGYGFITPSSGAKQVFVHIRAFNKPGYTPALNQVVSFVLSTDNQGRPCPMIAQQVLRHKSSKREFRAMFWMTVIANCAVLALLFTESGRGLLQSVLA